MSTRITVHTDTFCRDAIAPEEQWPRFLPLVGAASPGEPLNCASWLLDGAIAAHGAGRPCLVTATEVWSYGRLAECSDRIAHVLVREHALVPGNRVLIRGYNNPWTVACWFAVLKAGAVPVTTVALERAAELQAVVDIAAPALALCDERLLSELRAVRADGLRIQEYGGERGALAASAARMPSGFAAVATAPDDVALLAFTSGSTGRPKATVHFHRDVTAIAETFSRKVLRPGAEDVFAGSPPIGFTYGLGGLVVFPIAAGASTVLLEQGSPAALLDAIERHRVSVLFTAPTAYRALLAQLPGRDISSLRRCVSAGEPLSAALWHAFHDATGLRIIDGIGSTEMLHIFISAADEDIRPGAVGRVVPGFEAAVLDEDGGPVPDGTLGRLAVRGPTGCRYLADERQREYVQHGWNLTGDLFRRDADGYFWFHSRADDLIISAGYNISPAEVEGALAEHPAVREAAVVGLPDPQRGHVVCAYVVLGAGAQPGPETTETLQEFVKARIAPYKYPRVVRFCDSLPRNATGKLTRFRLRAAEAGAPETIDVPFAGAGAGQYPLTWGQTHILTCMQWLGSEAHYFNVRYARELPEGCGPEQVAAALAALIGRHQVLRSRFAHHAAPSFQTVHDSGRLTMTLHIAAAPDLARRAERVLDELRGANFTDEEWPVRAALVTAPGVPARLLLVFNHVAVDGWSLGLLTGQLDRLLAGEPDPGTSWQPADQVRYEREGQGALRGAKSLDFWRATLPTLPPTLFDRLPAATAEPLRYLRLEMRSQAAALAAHRVADRLGVSVSSVLLSASATVLGAVTGHDRVFLVLIVGNRFEPSCRSMVCAMSQDGLFVLDVDGGSFDRIAKHGYRASIDAYRYAYYEPQAHKALVAEADRAAGAKHELLTLFNDARRQDRWPALPPDAGATAAQLAQLAEHTTVTETGAWEEQNASYFVQFDFAADACLMNIIADTARAPRAVVHAALRATEQLLVAAAFADADPASTLTALTGLTGAAAQPRP